MTDKEEIKFAISYLKKGLKSKRTPPLYEELMNELGFVKKDKVSNLASVAEVRLANWQKLEKENAELTVRVENQKSFLERIRAKFNLGEIERKEIEGYLESDQLTKAKELIRQLCSMVRELNKPNVQLTNVDYSLAEAEQFISEVEELKEIKE